MASAIIADGMIILSGMEFSCVFSVAAVNMIKRTQFNVLLSSRYGTLLSL